MTFGRADEGIKGRTNFVPFVEAGVYFPARFSSRHFALGYNKWGAPFTRGARNKESYLCERGLERERALGHGLLTPRQTV